MAVALESIDNFLDGHEKSVVGFFTIVLALSTIGLWLATNKLWQAGERQMDLIAASSERQSQDMQEATYQTAKSNQIATETAERQLRAYVYVESTELLFKDDAWQLSFRVKNFGKTPAHRVRFVAVSEAVNWVSDEPSYIPEPDRDWETIGSMAPDGDFFDAERDVLGDATIEELIAEKKAIYLVGMIEYETVFEDERRSKKLGETRFRYYVGGDMSFEPGEMYADDDGNEAS